MRKLLLISIASLSLAAAATTDTTNTTATDTQNFEKAGVEPGSGTRSGAATNTGTTTTGSNTSMTNVQNDPAMTREIQRALKDKGHELGTVDGRWGSKSEAALRAFKREQGLPLNSELDSQTLSALGVTTTDSTTSSSGGPTAEPRDRQGRQPMTDETDTDMPPTNPSGTGRNVDDGQPLDSDRSSGGM